MDRRDFLRWLVVASATPLLPRVASSRPSAFQVADVPAVTIEAGFRLPAHFDRAGTVVFRPQIYEFFERILAEKFPHHVLDDELEVVIERTDLVFGSPFVELRASGTAHWPGSSSREVYRTRVDS